MCFFVEADWYADVQEASDKVSDGKVRCDECGQRVTAGVRYFHLYQRQHEECYRCEQGLGDSFESEEEARSFCEAEGHYYGQEYEYDCCTACETVLKAVEAVELREGCRPENSRPALGELRDTIWESDHRDEYLEEALAMDGGLAMSGHADRLFTSGDRRQVVMDLWDDDELAFGNAHCPLTWGVPTDQFDVGGEG